MSTIVTRAGKGSPLTNTEVDANFDNLNNDKYQSGDSPSFVKVTSTQTGTLPNFHAIGTSAGASNAPTILLERDSVSPANGDNMGVLQWQGNNDADESTLYAQLFTEIVNVADGSESGRMDLQIRTEGTLKNYLSLWTNGAQAEATINNAGTDIDFRVKGNSDDSLLYSDASLNRIGIGTSTPTSKLTVTSSSSSPLAVNRSNANGTMIDLQANGTTKSVIGYNSNNEVFVRTDLGGLRFSHTSFRPTITGYNSNDDAADLGTSTNRFKDLYLSSGIFLGGNASANKLDDYEEGTFTPVLSDASSGGTNASAANIFGYYTKIGDTVNVIINFTNIVTTGMTATNSLFIQSLPFASSATIRQAQTVYVSQIGGGLANTSTGIQVLLNPSSSVLEMKNLTFGGGTAGLEVSTINTNGSGDLWFNLTYKA